MRRALLALFFLAALVANIQAQETNPVQEINLDAQEKRIVETAYHDDKAVILTGPEAGGWSLSAGAAIDARRIDLRMHNVRGLARFRADTSRLRGVFDRSRRKQIR